MKRRGTKANIALVLAAMLVVAAGLLAVRPLRRAISAESVALTAAETATSAVDSPVAGACCTVEIRCDGLTNAMLPEGKTAPEDGCILATRSVALKGGDTAFDALRRACEAAGLALEYSYTPLYGSYYVEGIGNLYEFDGGETAGWVFSVNGGEPNQSSSAVTVADGDAVVWRYVWD